MLKYSLQVISGRGQRDSSSVAPVYRTHTDVSFAFLTKILRDQLLMLLLQTSKLPSTLGLAPGPELKGLNIDSLAANLDLFQVAVCRECQKSVMAAIPPCAFTARQIRESQVMKRSKSPGREPKTKYYKNKLEELGPLKYNSKLMNSIWGFYNRYSPHNVKKNNDTGSVAAEAQPVAGAAMPAKPEPKLPLPPKNFDFWTSLNLS